ncbi:MAG TPA: SUF system NifU family Fe-S cluster assembly protein [Candidatus Polarisedimenticolia bacterium]|nr:SUF system NifU family Fe-S cluster assembly protein [Candidatus Polarisedimenticolia bacterium]
MNDDLSELYQELILDHSRRPRNFRTLPDANCHGQGTNPICGDNYTIYARIEGGTVKDLTFQGSGCAISKASASLLTEALIGKTGLEVQTIFNAVRDMITTGRMDSDLGKVVALAGVHKFPERIKCAVLPWHAVLAAVCEAGTTVSTEAKKD